MMMIMIIIINIYIYIGGILAGTKERKDLMTVLDAFRHGVAAVFATAY